MPDEVIDGEAVTGGVIDFESPSSFEDNGDEGGEITAGSDEQATSPTYRVQVGGEEIEVSLDEALAGYQRQADYTRKTQELATQRTELDYASRLAAALETDPARAIEALQQAYQVSQQSNAPAPTDEPLDPEEARYASLEQRLAAQEQAAFERQVNATLGQLHTQFGQFDDVELVKFAVEHNIPDLQDAAKVFVFDKTFTKITADKQATAAKQELPPVASGHGVSAGAVTTDAGNAKPTIQEALQAAMAHHGIA